MYHHTDLLTPPSCLPCLRFDWWTTFKRKWHPFGSATLRSELLPHMTSLKATAHVQLPVLYLCGFPPGPSCTNPLNFNLVHPEWWYTWKPSLYPPPDTWRKWSKAPSPCCPFNMAQPQRGQKKPWNPFIFWLCWILKLPGLRGGWWAWHVYFVQGACLPCLWASLCPPSPGSLCSVPSSRLSQHGYYSRTVVLRLLERKYKCLVSDGHNISLYF